MGTELIQRDTVARLVENYEMSVAEVKEAYSLLLGAKKRLIDSFVSPGSFSNFDPLPDRCTLREESLAAVLARLKVSAWRVLIERLELRKLLSTARRAELDKQLYDESGASLPEITTESVWSLFEQSAANVGMYMEEAIKEVFEFLRPPGSKYKTNTEFEVGKRVILKYAVEQTYNKRGWRTRSCGRDAEMTALCNAFLILDGKGIVKSHHGELYDAIAAAPASGVGETEYFKFRCCMNANLHIEFKRLDLVARLNAVAGGARLRS